MRILLSFFALFFTFHSYGQRFGNEWIDYAQTYYKFKISDDGIYRISYQTLQNSNLPLTSIDPRNIQLYTKGQEVPIHIEGEGDGVFNSGDYIEFYAQKNDGWLDTALYNGIDNQPNPYYSLINDTITYYLTWNSSITNLRYIEENAIDFGNYFAAPFVWRENLQVYNSNYYDGRILRSEATNPEYTKAEGWMDAPLTLGRERNKTISTPNRYVSGPFVDFEISVVGASDWQAINNGDHHLRITFGSQTVDDIFEGYDLRKINRSFSPTELVKGNNVIKFESIDDRNAGVDRTALAYMKIVYPHTLSFSNESVFEFQVDDASSQNAQYLEILFFNGGTSPVLYDLTNRKKVRVVETLSNYKTIIPNGGNRKRCIIVAENKIKSIGNLAPVGNNGQFVDYRTVSLDTSFLILTHTQLNSQATTYAAYRRSKGMEALVVDVENLYDQYAYGIAKHPLAIRNFIDQSLTNWNYPPSHLFLVGKSVTAKAHRKTDNNSLLAYSQNLVPSYGNPSADNLLISGLNNTNLEVPIPLGRLSAKNLVDVDIYLDKVIEYEAAPRAKWMKRAIHFAGGKFAFEANTHENYLNGFAQDFEATKYGGKAFLFRKNSSAPYQTTLADSVRNLINEGVSLMTFFGHSSATGGFDISIDSPDKFENQGRYPVLLGNSCFAGNYHQPGVLSTSEQYVLERNKGVIAFIANGNLGVGAFLNRYSSAFYENISDRNYGESLAECMRASVKDVQSMFTEELLKNVCIEMSLQGDPAIVMNAFPQTDYLVEDDHVLIDPETVTTDLDSFKIKIRVDNLGLANNDSILVQLNRSFPISGTNDSTITRKIPPVLFESYIEFTFPINILTDIGQNEFTFVVDPFNTVTEIDENNNRIEFDLLIRSGEIIPVYPFNYSIVGLQGPTLSASTAFAFEEEKDYIFELDITNKFDSPSKISSTIRSTGGVLEWSPTQLQNMPDSMVYFWRVSKVPLPGDPFNWRTHSFQYIPGEEGFAQDHFNQFDRNQYLFLEQNKTIEQFDFTNKVNELSVVTIGSPATSEQNSIRYAIDADIREKGSCFFDPAFLIAVLDPITLESWETPYGNQNLQNDFGQRNVQAWCAPNRNRGEAIFNFRARDTSELYAMRDFLNNSIPDGSYIVAYNWFNIDYAAIDNIDTTILQAFKNLGATVLDDLNDGYPFIITAQKGNLGSVQERAGNSTTSRIEVTRVLATSADFGEMTSVELGPSSNFTNLSYRFTSLESNSQDSVQLELIGIDSTNLSTVVLSTNRMALDTSTSSMFNSGDYERLQLRFMGFDFLNQTPPQLERWQVSYDELPDVALSPNIYFATNKDSLNQGETLDIEVAIKNVSKTNMDSLEVRYNIIDSRNNLTKIATLKTAPLAGDSVLIARAEIPTQSLIGTNTLLIEVNPDGKQVEKNQFNNVGQYSFFVFADRVNPLLDVTFDGRHILNREIVSSNPTINIGLKDDNEFLAIDDTSSFSLYLRNPEGTEELVNFGVNADYELQFIPATLPENTARVIYKPALQRDGIYQLRVSAKDKSGNASGKVDYKVEFEIVTKSSITRLLNYPNPFSTSTRFVFTLTGNEIPDQVLIQIMTVTGKVVREIDENELGLIHIGNNVTEFAWDGKDEFGDQLANGVYLYRVKMKINGSNIERRSTKVDNYFKKDFGKMYLLR